MKVKLYLNKEEIKINKDINLEDLPKVKTISGKFRIPKGKHNKNFYFL